MTICALVAALVVLGIFAGDVFAQRAPAKQVRMINDDGWGRTDGVVGYKKALLADKDDYNWCADGNAVHGWRGKHTLYEWLDDTRRVFREAEAYCNAAGEKELLAACQKMREAGIVLDVCKWYCTDAIEVSRAAYTGPFFGRQGRRDDQFMVQIFWVKAYDAWVKAGEEYLKILSKYGVKTQAAVAIALYTVKGKQYEVENWRTALRVANKRPEWTKFGAIIYEYKKVPDALPGEANYQSQLRGWRQLFKDASDPNGKELKAGRAKPIGGGNVLIQHNLVLLMDCGSPIGTIGQPMITRDELVFILRQADQCWKDLLNPPEELLKDLPRYTYWQRDADPNEPSLILKVRVPRILCSWGHNGSVRMYYHLPNSFLKGLCPEWKQAAATGDEDELYLRYFAKERLKWHGISAEEYAKVKGEQEEWLRDHPGSKDLAYKLNLCANFQRLAPIFNDCSTTGGSQMPAFTLEALEQLAQATRVVAKQPKAVPAQTKPTTTQP